MSKKIILCIMIMLVSITLLAGCMDKQEPTAGDGEAMQYITADDLSKVIANGDTEYVIFDVRKIADYNSQHILSSVSADVDSAVSNEDDATATANLQAALTKTNGSDKKIVLLCYSGNRYAQKATDLLIGLGVAKESIYTLDGGYKGWTYTDKLE